MSDLDALAAAIDLRRASNLVHQCPGCWSVTAAPLLERHGTYECECGERLTRIDLRNPEPSPFRHEQAKEEAR